MQDEQPGSRGPNVRKAWVDEIQAVVSGFAREIAKAGERILCLGEDWNGEGAKPCKPETWNRASAFLERLALDAWKKKQKIIKAPDIALVQDGSIDIHWRTRESDVLVNIPGDDGTPATFSADDYGKNATRGTLYLQASNPILVSWLVEFS